MPSKTAPPGILEQLDEWTGQGWLRPLDRALAAFLYHEGEERDETVLLLAALTSQQLGQGHICLDLEHVLGHPEILVPEKLPDETGDIPNPVQQLDGLTAAQAAERLATSPVVQTGEGNTPLVLDNDRLYLRRYWQYEQTVAEGIHRLLAQHHQVPDDLGARLDTFFADNRARNPEQTDWQKIACALAARGHLTILTGGPGTGKTTTVVRLLGLLQSIACEEKKPLRIRLAAPTGKAAARLTESIGERIAELDVNDDVARRIPAEVTTLHRLLGRRPDSRHFRHHRYNPLHADLVVVDEASMIDLEMMASLLDALGPHTRLVLLGDKDQLASVEAGAVMGDLCDSAEDGHYDDETVQWIRNVCGEDISRYRAQGDTPTGALARQTAMLRQNHRFGADSGIGELARAINAGDAERVKNIWQQQPFADIQHHALRNGNDPRLEQLCVEAYRPYLEQLRGRSPAAEPEPLAAELLEAFGRFRLLCALRRGPAGVAGLNLRITEALHTEGLIPRTDGWYAGRPVIITRNDYTLGLMNGDIGITLPVAEDGGEARLRVAFMLPDKRIRLVLASRLAEVETVYAMTVHKSQGSEFDHTALVLPETDHPVLSRELLYTAVTRAKGRFSLLLSDAGIMQAAVRRKTWRASGLARIFHQITPELVAERPISALNKVQ